VGLGKVVVSVALPLSFEASATGISSSSGAAKSKRLEHFGNQPLSYEPVKLALHADAIAPVVARFRPQLLSP